MDKKTLTIVIACYNEEENVRPLSEEIFKVTDEKLPNYNVELLFIDNDSKDHTRDELRLMCAKNKNIKAIFNVKNFGHIRSPFHALTQAKGDIVMLMCADFQDPPETIPEFVHKWEEGYKIVVGVKEKSETNFFVNNIRKLYYRLLKKFSDVEQIEHFTGFGLYDQQFIKVLASLEDPYPYMRGIVAELGFKRYDLVYTQPKRRAGKSKNNFMTLYDMAMTGFTSYSKVLVRLSAFAGAALGFVSFVGFVVYLIFLFINLNGVRPSILWPILTVGGMFTALILFFVGMVGEYVVQINTRVMKRPLVIEEERINFEEEKKDQK